MNMYHPMSADSQQLRKKSLRRDGHSQTVVAKRQNTPPRRNSTVHV